MLLETSPLVRTTDLDRARFELERRIRQRILSSNRSERPRVISDAYAELFDKFPQHGALSSRHEGRRRRARRAARLVLPLTKPGDRVLEIGCGRGETLDELARAGRICFGMDPSRHMVAMSTAPSEVQIVAGTADKLDFPAGTFDLAFSVQMLEHLHPDDVTLHVAEAFRVLKPGGLLAFETPNKRTGPHDVSRGFSASAEGMHLKEWYLGELIELLREVGFVDLEGVVAPPSLARRSLSLRRISRLPIVFSWAEDLLLSLIPGTRLRSPVARVLGLEDLFVISRKP